MDLKFAIRQFVKSPAFTLIAVLTLAFGIGANTAIFSFVNAWIIRPLPYPDGDGLVVMFERNLQTGRESPTAPADWKDWRDQSGVFEELALYDFNVYNLTGEGDPIRLSGQAVSSNFFRTLGVMPVLGRDFTAPEQEPGAPRVAILSYELWRDRFDLDRDVLNRTIQIDGSATIVVGVMPETFHFSLMGRAKLWTPFTMTAEAMANRSARYLQVLGRMKKGVGLKSARAAIDAFQSGLSRAYPATNANRGVAMRSLHEEMGREAGNEPLLIIFGIVCFILLMACANVANLILARSSTRRKEIAVRLAIGAGRWRLVRQLLTETLLLFVCGALGGAFLARLGAHALTSLIPFRNRGYLPNYGIVEVDGTGLLFAFGVALLTGEAFGLGPGLAGTHFHINAALT